jgi:hypothetical protein
MPKFATVNPIYHYTAPTVFSLPQANGASSSYGALPAMIMELPAGSMIVNGQYVDAKTLTPKFGRIPGAVCANQASQSTSAPYAIVTSAFRQMTMMPTGMTSWLLSSYGRLNNNVYDSQYNKLHVYSVFPGTITYNSGYPVAGGFPGKLTSPAVYNISPYSPVAYSLWDGTTENSAADISISPAYSSAAAYNGQYGYTPMVFRIDTSVVSSTRYLWHTQGVYSYTVGTLAQQLWTTATQAYCLMYDTTAAPNYNAGTTQSASLVTLGQTLQGVSNADTRIFLYADNNSIWFYNFVTNAAPLTNANNNTTQYVYLKKMSYGGTETVIIGYWPKGLDGTHWPTQNLNNTTANVSIIIPVFDYINTPQVRFKKLLIDKASSTEIVSNITVANDPGQTISTAIYNKNGYGNLYASFSVSQSGGTVNDVAYRSMKNIMSWVTTMPSGNTYVMLGVTQFTRDADTTFLNYFKNGAKSYGYPQLDANQQFKIWSFQLDAGLTTATYISESDFSQIAPKYYFPLNDNWNTLYVGSMADPAVDTIWVFNEQSYTYQKIQTLPYNAAQVCVDGQSRLWTITTPGPNYSTSRDELNLETITIPYTANVQFANVNLIYTGANIATTANVDVFDAYGTRKSASLTLTIVGSGMTFVDGTSSNTYTTSSSVTTPYAFTVTGGNYSRIVATINQILS